MHPRHFPYLLARAATNVALRALSTSLVIEEMYRGTPVIYVDYTDYDEIAHHSGPERAESLDALDGVDATLASLEKAARDAPRPYKLVVLGSRAEPGRDVQAAVREADRRGDLDGRDRCDGGLVRRRHTDRSTPRSPRRRRRPARPGRWRAARSVDGPRTGRWTPRDDRAASGPVPSPDATAVPELVVAPSGNLALVSFPRISGRVTLEQLAERWPRLVPGLAGHPGVGLVMVRSSEHGAVVFGASGTVYLDDGRIEGEDPLALYGEYAGGEPAAARRDARVRGPGADLMLDTSTDEVAAFEELIGSHGGLGGPQTEPMLLHPTDWVVDEPLVGAEAVYGQPEPGWARWASSWEHRWPVQQRRVSPGD